MKAEDPAELLNLEPETISADERPGRWWLASILALIAGPCLCVVVELFMSRSHDYWSGLKYIVAFAVGLLFGAGLSFIFGVVSFARRERNRGRCLATLLLSLLILFVGAFRLVQGQLANRRYQAQLAAAAQFNADPSIALREHWDKSTDGERITRFQQSFRNPQTAYTPALLQRIYDEAPTMRDRLFAHPACTAEFLSAHFQEAWDRATNKAPEMLINIVSNPHTPSPLVEQVAQSRNLPANAVQAAQYTLRQRAAAERHAGKK